MKKPLTLIQKILLNLKNYLAELLVSFDQLPVGLARVGHSKVFCQDFAILRISGKRLSLSVPLQELIARNDILMHMHPLEVTLVRLLVEEERRLNGDDQQVPVWRSGLLGLPSLECFAQIERQFICPYTQCLRVVLLLPGQDQQECLTIHELVNDSELLAVLKSYSSYSYQLLDADWSVEQRVIG